MAMCRFLRDSSAATKEEAGNGQLRMITPMLHKYLPAINVDITVYFGGSDTEQILVGVKIFNLLQILRVMGVVHIQQ